MLPEDTDKVSNNHVDTCVVLGKEINPGTIKSIFNGEYIPDNTVVKVVPREKPPTKVSVIDMRVYPNQWVIMAKSEDGSLCDFVWPRDKFYTNF